MSIYNAFIALDGVINGEVIRNEKMSRHTSCRVGGVADLFVSCNTFTALSRCIEVLEEQDIRWVILGRGSNVIVSDKGFRGCVITLRGQFSSWQITDDLLTAGSGVTLPKLIDVTLSQALGGLEAFVGIPGTVGGALSVNTNAGTSSPVPDVRESIATRVHDIVVYRPGEGMHRYGASELQPAPSVSLVQEDDIILEATFSLNQKPKDAIAQTMERRLIRRRALQPVDAAACGFVFNNPPGPRSARELIESCDLKGYSVGGASVSSKHANFIVNSGGATAEDVVRLVQHIYECVKETHGIEFETAVKFLGFTP